MNVTVVKLKSEHYVLLIVMHHIIVDGQSLPILTNAISEAYNRHARGEEAISPSAAQEVRPLSLL